MNIDPIKNGIVIDHIEAGKGMEVYKFLKLDEFDCGVALIRNVPSKKMGKKDIIKIDKNVELKLDVLGYITPDATVSKIVDGKTVEKSKLALPETLINVIKCKNPRCITKTEHGINHEFKLVNREKKIYRCVYCESVAKDEE